MATKRIPMKMANIEITQQVFEKLNDLRGGVSISDFISELVTEHIKKQKKIPPEVVEKALVD
jgi:predicted CopG family antitoxin